MIGLDTNVLARYFVEEAQADAATQRQREAARQLMESGQDLYLPKTVALELEWVLRGYYGFLAEQVLQVLDQLLRHAGLEIEDRAALEHAVAGLRSGLDFADALHHASCRGCETIASFDDRGFARRIRQLNLPPRVVVPQQPALRAETRELPGGTDGLGSCCVQPFRIPCLQPLPPTQSHPPAARSFRLRQNQGISRAPGLVSGWTASASPRPSAEWPSA